ncbi:hypothetical protein AX15_004727 [Amanita polypyramis BW_CC]|nr:hypothetical protein AX15_004727 [Amanita polypyramis BW_CC]
MPLEPRFLNDKLEALVRKCIVFPTNGSETCIAPMVARTVTTEDITSLGLYSRCVDMASTFGDELRKTQVTTFETTRHGAQNTYLFFYNLSPNLPINLNVTRVVGVTPSHLKARKRLFWRGDLVVMKVQALSKQMDFIVESLDADLSELGSLEEFLRKTYQEGDLERLLDSDESQWGFYVSHYCKPTSLLSGPPESYWGTNAAEKEEKFLHDLNELRSIVGRPPLPRHAYMKSYAEYAASLSTAFGSLFCTRKVIGPPKLPPELERRVFENCALENPGTCATLVLVAKRVQTWIDPILISTVFISEDGGSGQRDTLGQFFAKLINGKPVGYYAQHVKNLAITGPFSQVEMIDRILAICNGVENLLLPASVYGLNFLENYRGNCKLRKLCIKLQTIKFGSIPNFHHPCFAGLTHLHLRDDDDDWPSYIGWETLTSLTHLALTCSGPPETVKQLMQTLPSIRYVALGYYGSERYNYAETVVDNRPHFRAAWGTRIVVLSLISRYDWVRGARGEGDFWEVVEREVERRLQEGSAD